MWKMIQELGYEKQLKHYGTQVTYEGSEPVWHVQVYIVTPSLSEEYLRWRRFRQPLLEVIPSTLEFVMLLSKLRWPLVCAIANSWMEWSMPIFPNELVDLPKSMWCLYPIQGTSSSRNKWNLPLRSQRN
jgi:hypothetical protein